MNVIISLLKSLGVDSTIWIQLGCFFVSYLALTQLVFKPYMRAFHEREKRTVGNADVATKIIEETQALQADYELKMRAQHARIREIHESHRLQAQHEYDNVIHTAREQADHMLEASRLRILQDVQAARAALMTEIPQLSSAIAARLSGKDLTS